MCNTSYKHLTKEKLLLNSIQLTTIIIELDELNKIFLPTANINKYQNRQLYLYLMSVVILWSIFIVRKS